MRRRLLAGSALALTGLVGAGGLTPARADCTAPTPMGEMIDCVAPIADGTTYDALAGNDTIVFSPTAVEPIVVGDLAASQISGGLGDDIINSSGGANVVILGRQAGSEGVLLGEQGNDQLFASNLLVGVAGTGQIAGNDGDDSLVLTEGSRVGAGDGGHGIVSGNAGNDTIVLAQFMVVANHANAKGEVTGDGGNDSILVDGALVGALGSARLDGGSGDDTITFNQSRLGLQAGSSGLLTGAEGSDIITFANDSFTGGKATISGGADGDLIEVVNASSLSRPAGSETLLAGDAGDDTVRIADSSIGEGGKATVSGGEGADRLLIDGSSVGVAAGSSGMIGGDEGADFLQFSDSTLGLLGGAVLTGGAGNDTLRLDDGSRLGAGALVDGGADDDSLELEVGLESLGPHTLSGGAGADTLLLFGTGEGEIAVDTALMSLETLRQQSGIWLWRGTHAFAADGAVAAGVMRLAPGAELGFGSGLELAAGSRLDGRGRIAGDLANAGLVAPGDPTSLDTTGTLEIAGDYSGSGSALLALEVTLGGGGDLLRIGGEAAGSTSLALTLLGIADPAADTLLVEVAGESAPTAFTLLGGPFELGLFTYDLALLDDGNWYLAARPVIAPENYAVAGSAALLLTQASLSPLHQRLGDVRAQLARPAGQQAALGAADQEARLAGASADPTGLWFRALGEQFDADGDGGSGFEQRSYVLQGGADLGWRDLLGEGDLLLGGLFGSLLSAEITVDGEETSFELEGGGFGLYATYAAAGLHLDAVAQMSRLTLTQANPGYDFESEFAAWTLGLSLEAGWRLALGERFFLEPAAQLAYAQAWVEDSQDPGGEAISFDDTASLRGRLALRGGAELALGGARLLPYAEIGVVQEFLGDSQATLDGIDYGSDLGGTSLELGLGLAALDLADHLQLHLDADYLTGDKGTALQITGGLRVTW